MKLCRSNQSSKHFNQSLKECSSQYSVLTKIHIVTGNEKFCKIHFKKLFFHNALAFIDLFYGYHYLLFHLLRLHVTSCVYNMYRSSHQRCSLKKGVLKNLANFTGKHLCWSLFLIKLQAWGTPILKNICGRLLLYAIKYYEKK